MAKDPGFVFYPGDYLRDTQCLSESVQVAYDRIMCEHMRNICISKSQLKFFTKRLNEDEIAELMTTLKETESGFQIEWVADSINKRKAYSASRKANRTSKTEKDMINISKTYVKHMDNEIEIEDVIVNDNLKRVREKLCSHFKISEVTHFTQFKLATEFLQAISSEIDYFESQLENYIAYSKGVAPKYQILFSNFIGSQKEKFTDGKWNKTTWPEVPKLKPFSEIGKNQNQKYLDMKI